MGDRVPILFSYFRKSNQSFLVLLADHFACFEYFLFFDVDFFQCNLLGCIYVSLSFGFDKSLLLNVSLVSCQSGPSEAVKVVFSEF